MTSLLGMDWTGSVGSWTGRAALAATPLLLASCSGAPREVVYDLAHRSPVAELWSAREVLLIGTPASDPALVEGFYREARGAGEPFRWARGEAEVALHFDAIAPRAAIVDMAPYEGVEEQSVEVRLNRTAVGGFRLSDLRSRYRIDLPSAPQRAGENRLRFVFAETASPAERDPGSHDRRHLAAALYSLTTGPADDAGLEDLLRRDAPRPFGVAETGRGPSLSLVGPAVVRFAIRLPEAAELRFTPDLTAAARAAAGAASFRVTIETENEPGAEHELWAQVIRGNDPTPAEVSVRLPGEAGGLARVGLAVGAADGGRFAWGTWTAPRMLGRGGAADPLAPGSVTPADDARADTIRRGLENANVILVVLDAARAREFGTYGYGRNTTPVIDEMATDGVVFDRAYTPAVYTLGAMSSVWTSQYPDRHHGDVSFSSPLPPDRLTLAEVLTRQGIHSAGFVATAVPGGFNGFDRGFSEFHEVWQEVGSRADVFRQVIPPWLVKNASRRFFAYIHFREPHYPYDPEPPFDTMFGPEGPIPKAARRDMEFFRDVNQQRRAFSREEREHLVRLYDGNLAYVDHEIGALRDALESAGVWDRTLLIVTADHGEGLMEHGWIGHNVQVYDEDARIPLVLRFPRGDLPRGVRVGELVDLLDIAPTVADVFGVRDDAGAEREFQGRSLLPLVEGAPGKPLVVTRTVWDRPRYALRDGRWTYLYDSANGEERLFDTAKDPGETRNVASRHPLRSAWFRETLHQWMRTVFRPGVAEAGAPPAMSREQCENLKALGYIPADETCPES
jgi:arylsulfatase A-like enzyme